MKIHPAPIAFAVLVVSSTLPAFASPRSDLVVPQNRQVVVGVAKQILGGSRAETEEKSINPFNPPNFDQPSAEDTRNSPAALPAGGATAVPSRTDREILQSLALRFPATGSMIRGEKTLLTAGRKQFEVGEVLVIPDGGHEYELEITAISATTFTLRYRAEEFTRPIRSVK